MTDAIEIRPGNCPTHGAVQAGRPMPRPSWPFAVYAIRRMLAGRRPYRCPECGAAVA